MRLAIVGPLTDEVLSRRQAGRCHRPRAVAGQVVAATLHDSHHAGGGRDLTAETTGVGETVNEAGAREASLSFLGFGLPLKTPSWGGMLSREGRQYMEMAPWLALWPGLCLTLTVYSLNMFGDAMRDLLDPRLRGGGGRLGADAARSV